MCLYVSAMDALWPRKYTKYNIDVSFESKL